MGRITLRQAADWCGGWFDEKYAPIIFFTPFTLLKTLYFPRLSVSLGMIKVYNGVAKEYISKSAH